MAVKRYKARASLIFFALGAGHLFIGYDSSRRFLIQKIVHSGFFKLQGINLWNSLTVWLQNQVCFFFVKDCFNALFKLWYYYPKQRFEYHAWKNSRTKTTDKLNLERVKMFCLLDNPSLPQ